MLFGLAARIPSFEGGTVAFRLVAVRQNLPQLLILFEEYANCGALTIVRKFYRYHVLKL